MKLYLRALDAPRYVSLIDRVFWHIFTQYMLLRASKILVTMTFKYGIGRSPSTEVARASIRAFL